jgi:phosphoglucosamine mutase
VHTIHDSTDGYSINDGCGSTALGDLRAAVVRESADIGFAFDGDADRCLAADATGAVVDGDQILAVLARAMRDRGELVADTVVATVMSNLGSCRPGRARDHRAQTAVATGTSRGDAAGGFVLGGSSPARDHGAACDDRRRTAHRPAHDRADGGHWYARRGPGRGHDPAPQVLVNVAGVDKSRADSDPDV